MFALLAVHAGAFEDWYDILFVSDSKKTLADKIKELEERKIKHEEILFQRRSLIRNYLKENSDFLDLKDSDHESVVNDIRHLDNGRKITSLKNIKKEYRDKFKEFMNSLLKADDYDCLVGDFKIIQVDEI